MKKELIELGSIVDMDGNRFDVYCESLTFTGKGEDLEVTCEGIVIEECDNPINWRLTASSLADMPDRFSQKQVNSLEDHILEEKRNELQAYYADLYADAKRGDL